MLLTSVLALSLMILAVNGQAYQASSSGNPFTSGPTTYSQSANIRGFTVVTTTTISETPSASYRSRGGYSPMGGPSMMPGDYPTMGGSHPRGSSYPGNMGGSADVRNYLSDNDISILNSSWNVVKNRGGFAPKVFVRYIKAKPEAQKYFPNFANVSVSDLPSNQDFLARAYACVHSLNSILPALSGNANIGNCPIFQDLKNKYNEADLKRFGSIWMTSMQEEMGNKFTTEVREAWKNAIMAFTNFASSK